MIAPDWRLSGAAGAASSLAVGLAALTAVGGLLLLGVRGADIYDVFTAVLATGLIAVPTVGRALIRAEASSALGWLLLASGCGLVIKLVLDEYARAVYTHGAALPHPAAAEFVSGFGTVGQIALGAIVPLLVTGRLPAGRRWRWALAAGITVGALAAIGNLAPTFWHFPQVANPWAVSGTAVGVSNAANVIVVIAQNACYIAAALSVGMAIRQLRGADPAAVGPLRALVLLRRAAWLVTASYLACLVLGGSGATNAVYAGEHFALLVFAVSAWVAISRHGLVDARQVLDRALRYGVLTGLILVSYAVVIAVVGQAAAGRLPALLAVAVAALVALPLREAAQRGVARLVWGHAGDPAEALTRLSARLTAAALPAQTLEAAARTVGESLRVGQVVITTTDDDEVLASWERPGPRRPAAWVAAPLTFAGEQIGWLRVTLRPGEISLPKRSARLLTDVSPHIAAAVQALTSTAALEASKERLIQLRNEERGRIRRDLHDGLGPTLSGIGLGIERARDDVGRDPGQAMAVLTDLGEHARRAAGEVRRMVHDLYPSALAEHGLAGALSQETERLGVTMTVGPGFAAAAARLPEPVESAAYRIALEAMTNAVRHSGAGEIVLMLDVTARALIVEVDDDGRGISPDVVPGLGLNSMRQRGDDLGGTVTVTSGRAGGRSAGTVVRAELPLVPQPAERPEADEVSARPLSEMVG